MSFIRYMAVLNVISQSETGVTSGQIQKTLQVMSLAQVKLTLRDLVGEGAVVETKYQYREHIIASRYTLAKVTAQQCAGIARNYADALKQQVMPIANYQDNNYEGVKS